MRNQIEVENISLHTIYCGVQPLLNGIENYLRLINALNRYITFIALSGSTPTVKRLHTQCEMN